MLKGEKGLALGIALAQANAAQAVVANDAAPAGIVQIETRHFLLRPNWAASSEATLKP